MRKDNGNSCSVQGLLSTSRLLGVFGGLTAFSILFFLLAYSQDNISFNIIAMPLSKNSISLSLPSRWLKLNSEPEGKTDASIEPTVQMFDELAPLHQQKRVNCSALFAGDKTSTDRAVAVAAVIAQEEQLRAGVTKKEKKTEELPPPSHIVQEVKEWYGEFERLTNQWYHNATLDCESFKRRRGYITSSLTQEEENFPIAFSLLVFKDIEMVDRLLRSVYRPQNRYCIHVDSKSDAEFYSAVQSVAACFPDNVRMSSRRVDVQWGHFSVLEPELICMEDLWDMDENKNSSDKEFGKDSEKVPKQKKEKWKYFINLTGQEFPLKTNHELVKIMKAIKGANSQEGTRVRANKNRWFSTPPHGIIPTKGGVHTLLNRATIDFILHDKKSKDFIKWLRGTRVPDETLFASLNYNPHLNIPGTYNGTMRIAETYSGFVRYKEWYGHNCYSQRVTRSICIISVGDLPRLAQSPKLAANKFYLHQDRIVIGCLEERHFNNTRDEFLGVKTFNTTPYENLDAVIHMVPGNTFG